MIIELSAEEAELMRQSLGQSCADIGGRLSQAGMPGVPGAMQMLSALSALDAKIGEAMKEPPKGPPTDENLVELGTVTGKPRK